MTTETNDPMTEAVLENTRATRDLLSVDRVFGQPYEVEGRTVIPVASVRGGGGGGGGSEEAEGSEGDGQDKTGGGFGSGFGITARPVGVYVVDDDGVEWKPALDAVRLIKGGQVLAGIITVCVTLVALRRWPR